MKTDILYLAYNRLAFTQVTFEDMLKGMGHGDWNRLVILDDGSTDGTYEWLEDRVARMSAQARAMVTLERTNFKHPVASMNYFVERYASTGYFAKIDNDAVMPRGWLRECIKVLRQHPELDNLGIEALMPVGDGERSYSKVEWISGLGFYRASQWQHSKPAAYDVYFGLENWMHARESVCGWINPAIPVFLLDRLPIEPYTTLSKEYEAKGWQRPWEKYPIASSGLWGWRFPCATS